MAYRKAVSRIAPYVPLIRKGIRAYNAYRNIRGGYRMVTRAMSKMKGRKGTKTRRKRKLKEKKSIRVLDLGYSKFKIYKKGSEKTIKRWMKDGIKVKHNYMTSDTYTSTNGLQAVNQLPVTMYTRSDIDTINQKVIDAVVTGTVAIQGYSGLRKAKLTTLMKNQTNDEIEVWLYNVTLKRDLPSADETPINAWDIGVDNQTGTAGTPYDYPYADPRESELFKSQFNVLRKVHYRMKSGSMATDEFTFYPNKIMNEQYLQIYNNCAAYKGLSVYTLMVQLGPVGRRTGVAPTYGISRVDVVQKVEYLTVGHADRRDLQTNVRTLDIVAGNVLAMTDADETSNAVAIVPA